MEKKLGDIFKHYGTDKEINGYTPYYERIFETMRHQKICLGEIGIGTLIPGAPSSMVGYGEPHYQQGASLKSWRDYFDHPETEIHGFDIQQDTQFIGEPKITTHLLNSTDSSAVKAFVESPWTQFDILIDDGAHYDQCQLATVQNLWSTVKSGGIYVVEDVYPSSRLVTDYVDQFNAAIEQSPWLLSTKRNLLFVFKRN
jgi:hypothetical protein